MKPFKIEDRLLNKIISKNLNFVAIVDGDSSVSVDDSLEFVNSSNKAVGVGVVDQVLIRRLKEFEAMDNELKEQLEYLRASGDVTDLSPVKVVYFSFQAYEKPKNLTGVRSEELRLIKMFSDGGSRGNPGPSASGYVLMTTEDKIIKSAGVYLGITTNNQAEYKSLKFGMEDAKTLGAREIDIFMDSQLVINQMNGVYKIKHPELIPIYKQIKELEAGFDKVTYTHVPREFNKLADAEVNKCLDSQTD